MYRTKKSFFVTVFLSVLLLGLIPLIVYASGGEEHISNVYGSFWGLLPPIIAIALALITKEVYSSLAVGIFTGALLYANFNLELAVTTMFTEGFISNLSDEWNVGILIFLVTLGSVVILINKAGGSAAYGEWAKRKIKSRKGAQLATLALGVIIFVDDYFNCLTVGNVMRPVTDANKVSRSKLAYIVDSTAAPVCMIAPISSWAAAVTGVAGFAGLSLFVKAIPFNFYSLLTLFTVLIIILWDIDFGQMRVHEENAINNNDLHSTDDRPVVDASENAVSSGGKVIDLVLPVGVLIAACIVGMVYTGGIFDGVDFITAFAESDASLGLALGAFVALVFTIVFFLCRRVLSFKECMSSLPSGFIAMVPAILILTFAWTLSSITGLLGGADFMAGIVEGSAGALKSFLPAIVFLIAVGMSFATGTSWGTFGILIPIVVSVLDASDPMLIISVSACLAGAVCGDHCSPISDTTIMSSAGAQCNHINHVSTQLPYALLVASVSFVTYIIAGFVKTAWIALPSGIVLMAAALFAVKTFSKKKSISKPGISSAR